MRSWAVKVMRSDAKLVDLEAGVHSIRRTRTGGMIVELKGAACKSQTEEVLGDAYKVVIARQEV